MISLQCEVDDNADREKGDRECVNRASYTPLDLSESYLSNIRLLDGLEDNPKHLEET